MLVGVLMRVGIGQARCKHLDFSVLGSVVIDAFGYSVSIGPNFVGER